MLPEITMKELIILVLCFVIYVVAVEVYEGRITVASQGELVQQEQGFHYTPEDDAENIEFESSLDEIILPESES